MKKSEIKSLIEKYDELAEITADEEKSYQYNRFAMYLEDYLEDNPEFFNDEKLQTEKALVDAFNKEVAEFEEDWTPMLLPNDDADVVEEVFRNEIFQIIENNARNQYEQTGLKDLVTEMLNANYTTTAQIYHFVTELFETDYEPLQIIIPWIFRREIDKYMNDFKKDLDKYKLYFIPHDEPSPQGWNELRLDCDKVEKKDKKGCGSVILHIHFNHAEKQVLIPTILFTQDYIFIYQGMREKILSILLKICLLSGYRLFLVDLPETLHAKLLKRGATCLDFETVEITRDTNLDADFNDTPSF